MEGKSKILIVEDEQSVLKAYIKALEKDYEIVIANNGEEGIEKMKKENPDLILLDIIMPIKHGHDFLLEKKNMDEFRDIPVFVMTNVKSEAEHDKAMQEGAMEYFVKFELKLENLLVSIEKALKASKES